MAAPSYTTDLTDWIADGDTTAWSELTTATNGGAPDEVDTESALQGTNTVSQITNTTALFSMCRILGSPVTLSSGQVFLVWHGHGVATALATYANGGLRLVVAGSTVSDWKAWAVNGVDTPPFPYGKWVNNPVDPTVTADYTNGTPPTGGTSVYGVGSMGILTQVVARGQPHVVDIIRYGRAEARINGGETANYATFAGFATQNDTTTNRWGLIQATDGGYLWKGLITLGYTSLVDFRDSNKTILVQDTRKVSSTFNKIEIRQATSNVEWVGITITNLSPSTTASKGDFEVIDNATVAITSCTFNDMATFQFLSNTTVDDTSFTRCGQITANSAIITNSSISNYSGASDKSALVWNTAVDPNGYLDGTTFTKGTGTTHAIEFGLTSPTAMTLTDVNFSGYGADASTSAALHIKRTTGTVTINVVGGSTPTYKSDGATVVIVSGTVSVTLKAQTATGTAIASANVFVQATSGGPFPVDVTVTIVNSGTTATVTHTAHGLAVNDKILIKGASLDANNGVFTITGVTTNTYTYTMGSTPGSSPTGTITSTFVILSGTTNGSGEITMSRVFSSAQPFSGWARKSTTQPYYKTGLVSGTVSITAGANPIALMIADE